jgi:hypothetical protein
MYLQWPRKLQSPWYNVFKFGDGVGFHEQLPSRGAASRRRKPHAVAEKAGAAEAGAVREHRPMYALL